MALCGRADLVRILREPEKDAFLASLVGYVPTVPTPAAIPLPQFEITPSPEPATAAPEWEAPPSQIDWEPLPFYYPATFEPLAEETTPGKVATKAEVLTRADLANRQLQPGAVAPSPPRLAPWPRLHRQVAGMVQTWRPSRMLDVPALLRQFSRGGLPRALPLQLHKHWPRQLHVVVDRSLRMTPYWHDQDDVLQRLRRLLGPAHVHEFRQFDGMPTPLPLGYARRVKLSLTAGAPILVLGDCGCLSGYAPLVEQWQRLGCTLRQREIARNVLFPAAAARWPKSRLAAWRMATWETAPASKLSTPSKTAEEQPPLESLLTLAAPAVRVEPGLLRMLRRLHPDTRHDAGFEAEIWNHPALTSGSSVAFTLATETLETLRTKFQTLSPELRAQALQAIRLWREALPKEIWHEELLSLAPADQQAFPLDREAAQQDFLRLAATIQHGDAASSGFALDGLKAWFRRFHPRTRNNLELWRTNAALGVALHQAEAVVYRDEPVAPTAVDADPRLIGAAGHERVWTVRQMGEHLRLAEEGPTATNAALPGSPLGHLPATRPIVQQLADIVKPIPAETGYTTTLRLNPNTGQRVEGRVLKPVWASAMGKDQYGIWVTFEFGAVEQRLRWIVPGRFMMGSPKSEQGRYDDEVHHRVTLTHGFWLFETPVTQALWNAVMKNNPSKFKEPQRPVEQVSWDDCQEFMVKLNQQLPGLALRLPTEAEWEYACRAGTTTATYAGDLKIKNEKAKALDDIAWYNGNSKNETHAVAQKAPNAWGLFDMLGNVWEWCNDRYAEYSNEEAVNPTGPDQGAGRVYRGGSWFNGARYVRAAYRYLWPPGNRSDYLGFRCARGQDEPGRPSPARGVAEPGPAERPGARNAEKQNRTEKRKKK